MNNYYQNNEMEIDLIGLCIYVFKQWRKLLVFFLVGAIIGCGVSYFKMTSFDPYDPAKVEQYFAKLKPDELDKEMIGQYADFNNLYDETCDRKEDSVILNMDSTLVYSGSLSYFVSSENDDIDEISAYYNSLFDRDDNWDRLLKASGLDCNEAAFKELAWVSFSKSALDNQIVSDTNVIEKRSASLSFGFTSPTRLHGMQFLRKWKP